MFEVLVSMQLFVFDIAANRELSFDFESLQSHLDRQIRAAEEGDNVSYYESYLLFVETILSTVQNRNMLEILEKIKGKYIFKLVSYRKQHAQSLPKPSQAKTNSMRIYEALKRGDIEEAKTTLHELNELVYKQFMQFDI
jgi:DNA-binding GntR family transcriptional regulator